MITQDSCPGGMRSLARSLWTGQFRLKKQKLGGRTNTTLNVVVDEDSVLCSQVRDACI